ncbi:unnamed protein product [Prorocentrum cordatum]|uniref:Uncharacterized protein n=1 Tax=Prorocentrum cordatum TaxID=2364126 RepID=A0ABN9WI78_9DINO|nr:unnamed protein product [Polarella glacialis]
MAASRVPAAMQLASAMSQLLAKELRRKCRNVQVVDDVINWVWKQVIKPQAQKHANLTDRVLEMMYEETKVWKKVKKHNVALDACVSAVKLECNALSVFTEKREAVALALRILCQDEMKEVFLRPLLVHMDILDDYDRVNDGGYRKIDIVGADSDLGQRYRRGIIEYSGASNMDVFLRHLEATVNDLQDADVDKAFGAGVGRFVDLVREARASAPVVDAGESVLSREPFQDFLSIVYPCY